MIDHRGFSHSSLISPADMIFLFHITVDLGTLSSEWRSLSLLGKPLHTVELLLAERLYQLRDNPEILEFYGPPHPEDPQGRSFVQIERREING